MHPALKVTTLAAFTLATIGCASMRTPTPEPDPITYYETGRFRVSGQPAETDLEQAAADGIALVLNVRSDREVDRLDYDEQQTVESLGMAYAHIPMGGDNGYEPEQLAAFEQLLAETDGTIYLHCGSGTRARKLWMAHQIASNQLTVDQAHAAEREIGGKRSMLEELLDADLSYEIATRPASESAD